MSNRLIDQTSPYLLQHARNPVDWYPWGPDAFAKARAEDKPVFLSVGYSACHWCHVMERESFESEVTAALMNRDFVSIKVDREERPDVDAIYMEAVQAMTQRGGWPLSAFLTPEGLPFFGGTYFPDRSRYGMPSFREVLAQIARLWDTDRARIVDSGERLAVALKGATVAPPSGEQRPLDADVLDAAIGVLERSFDAMNGGWGGAPKFPQPAVAEFVLRRYQSTGDERLLGMVTATLDAMANGGIYDHLGGGFHRYATDEDWLVPHFEKMLYDNAQLARLYLHAYQVTGEESYRRVTQETLDFVAREMLDASGGFYSALDADSEGSEGRFYVWTEEDLTAALAEDAAVFKLAYGVTPRGNFEGRSILFAAKTPSEVAEQLGSTTGAVESAIARARTALLGARESRVRPGLDDKVLTGWNGLALAAFAEAARILGRDDYRTIAEKNAEFVLAQMRTPEGRMLRSWRGGRARLNGYLEDHAHYADGLLELYQTTFDPRWFLVARELGDTILAHFADPDGGFFDTSDDHEELLLRPAGLQDGAVPSGGAVSSAVLLKLGAYTGEDRYTAAAEAALARVQAVMAQAPLGLAAWLAGLDLALAGPQELAIVGAELGAMLGVVHGRFRPNLVVAARTPSQEPGVPLLADRDAVDGQTTAHLCRRFACEKPVVSAEALEGLLAK